MDDETQQPMGQLSAHLDRGWDLVSRGDFAGAVMSAEKSLELDQDSPDAHNLLGYIFQSEGRPEEALEHYRAALELDESYVDAMLNAADVLVHPLRRWDEALELVREALDWLEPDEIDERADALLLEVEIHLARGDREAARKTAKELPDGPFENPALPMSVGRACLEVGDLDRAEPLLLAALGEHPSADAHYYVGLVHEARERPRDALLSFLRARELDLVAPPLPWSLAPEQFEGRVQTALGRLSPEHSARLEGALVVVTDLPGAEVVAEGIDPRLPVLLDALPPPESTQAPRAGRVFVYRRNVERVAMGLLEVENEIVRALEAELDATFNPPETEP